MNNNNRMDTLAGWFDSAIDSQQAGTELAQMLAAGKAPGHAEKMQPVIELPVCLAAEPQQTVSHLDCVLILTGAPVRLSVEQQQAVIADYRANGLAFLNHLRHGFGLALYDRLSQSLILAVDPLGQRSIYYSQTPTGLVFASSADAVIAHSQISRDLRLQSIYDYVYFHHCPSPHTIYQQVRKLENSQCLVYQNAQLELRHYWQPAFLERNTLSLKELGQQLQTRLIDAVRELAVDEQKTGAFLSGGLDSSSVAGALSRVFPGQAKTFSMGFPVERYNELDYAHLAVNHFNTRQHEYIITPDDAVNAIPAIAAYYDEPFGNSSALAVYYCAKLAKENGIEVLLAGDGGDEIFAGNERYAKQKLFDYYQQLPRWLAGSLEWGLAALPQGLAKQKLPFKAKRYVEQALTAMPDRLQDYNFLHRHAADTIFQADFLAQIDTGAPLQQLRDSYWRPQQAGMLNRMLYLDWKTTLHDNDLVKVNKMCEMLGVAVRYPLLEQSIVDLSCQIPSSLKLKGQKLRWFYKQAMADFLPDGILNKSKHGFGLPFGVWLQDHQPLQDLAYDAIASLKKREFFKAEFLDHAIEVHRSVHAAYYGELIWVLMMLELWLQARELK